MSLGLSRCVVCISGGPEKAFSWCQRDNKNKTAAGLAAISHSLSPYLLLWPSVGSSGIAPVLHAQGIHLSYVFWCSFYMCIVGHSKYTAVLFQILQVTQQHLIVCRPTRISYHSLSHTCQCSALHSNSQLLCHPKSLKTPYFAIVLKIYDLLEPSVHCFCTEAECGLHCVEILYCVVFSLQQQM